MLLHYYKLRKKSGKIVVPGVVFTEDDHDYECLKANLSDLTRISIYHFIPQVTFLTEKDQMKMDYLYKMEEIEIYWTEICNILGKELPLLRNNPTDFGLIDRPFGKNDLSAQEHKIVRESYRNDFEMFGYQAL